MIWAFSVLSYRAIRGSREEPEDYYYDGIVEPVIIFDGTAEELVLPPPEYTDEKVALADVEQKDNETAQA